MARKKFIPRDELDFALLDAMTKMYRGRGGRAEAERVLGDYDPDLSPRVHHFVDGFRKGWEARNPDPTYSDSE